MVNRLLLLAMILSPLLLAESWEKNKEEYWQSGKAWGGEYKNFYGENFKEELADPLSTNKKFRTREGESFSANLTCNEEILSFMSVGYSLDSPRHGIRVEVRLDRDLDGIKEYHFRAPYVASGICPTGIVECEGGEFQGACNYYEWGYSHDILKLIATTPDTMSGCLCVNDSCDSMAIKAKGKILETIGAGIYAKISPQKPKFILSKATNNAHEIDYFGQRLGECANLKDQPPSPELSKEIEETEAIQARELENKNSAFSSLHKASQNYATTNPSIKPMVNTTQNSSYKTRQTLEHQEGTTAFSVDSSKGRLKGKVGIPLEDNDSIYCQVQWLESSPEVFTDNTHRANATTSAQQYRVETRECIGNVCPHQKSKGESIKHGCDKIDNFSEVTSALSALNELSEDMICAER